MWWMMPWWNPFAGFDTSNAEAVAEAKPAENAAPNVGPYYQTLATQGDHAFGVWTKGSGFSLFSANWDRVVGVTAGQCAGEAFLDRVHPRDAEMLKGALQALPTRISAPQPVDCRILNPEDSSEERVLMLGLWPMNQDGLYDSVMVLAKDVTELRYLLQQYQRADTSRVAAEKGRSAFLSNMSHELRTPLNAIMGFTDVMRHKLFGEVGHPTYEEYVQDIHFSSQHLLGKINDLLDIAAIDQNRMGLDEEEIPLAQLMQDMLEPISHMLFERGIKLVRDLPREQITLLADRRKLICILTHFLSNAIRHCGSEAKITVTCRVQRAQGLILSVRDEGEGITAMKLANIVSALQSKETYFAVDGDGIGLGLSLAKELAARHDGTISLDSIRNKGTVVSLILPPERVLRGYGTPDSRRGLHLAKQ
jgi:signal transduction histidine kinase